MAKTYGQFCGLARALDHVGDRWTLLVVRELMLGEATYSDLHAALPGVPTNLLADRLRELQDDGLVTRRPDGGDRRRALYGLTDLGRGLEPVVFELIRWGARWMRPGAGDDYFDPRWVALAVEALLQGRTPERAGTVELRLEGAPLRVVSEGAGELRVEHGDSGGAVDATADGNPGALLALVAGELSMSAASRRGLRVRGDRSVARALLVPA